MTEQVQKLTREALTIQPSAVAAIPRETFLDLARRIDAGEWISIVGEANIGAARYVIHRGSAQERALIEALKAAAA